MSISSTTRKVGPSACNGVVTAFPFSFKVFQASDLLVVLTNSSGVESTLTLTTDYTVSLNANQDSNPGGTITTNTAYATGNAITIGSNIPQTQTVTLSNNGGFYPTVLNDFFDKIVILVQQMTEKLNRSFSLPFSASSSISTSLPLPSAGKSLKWAADGLSLINSTNDPDVSAAAAASSATAAANSATAASASAASALASLQSFQGTYYGTNTVDPSTDPLGNAPTAGDLYYNTSSLKLRIYSGSAWQDTAVATPASFTSNLFSGNGATTAFTLSSAPASAASTFVSIGGVVQRPTTDFTISGTTLTFTAAPPAGTNNILALVVATATAGVPNDGSVTGAKLTTQLQLSGQSIEDARSTVAATATTTPLWTAGNGNIQDWTGTPTITAFPNAPQAGSRRTVYPAAGTVITNNANISVSGGASYTVVAGDRLDITAITSTTFRVEVLKADGTAVTASSKQLQSITAAVATNALTLTYNGGTLDFRNTTLTNGVPISGVVVASNAITVPSGATLGTVNATAARLVLLEAYNGGTPVACVANIAGGLQLDETNLISPTTISGTSNSNNVIYSASAVAANSPYRVVGYIDITEATAGTWATSPTTVQGAGGQALAALSSFGFGQTWQNVTASRVSGTTYYNTTGKPIQLMVTPNATGFTAISINGVSWSSTGNNAYFAAVIPPGWSYALTGTINAWFELR